MKSVYKVRAWYSPHAPKNPLLIYFTNNKMVYLANHVFGVSKTIQYVLRLSLGKVWDDKSALW